VTIDLSGLVGHVLRLFCRFRPAQQVGDERVALQEQLAARTPDIG
jgi:hypothetical protein